MTKSKTGSKSLILVFVGLLYSARQILVAPVIIFVACTIVFYYDGYELGETIVKFDIGGSIYLSFITALTIGFGDLHPSSCVGRFAAVLLGVAGILTFGVVVSAITKALERVNMPKSED